MTCTHDQGHHYIGDCGDTDAMPQADWITRAARNSVQIVETMRERDHAR